MATLNQMIAQGAQFNIPDPVAQYNKLAQMQQYKTQNELSQQEAIDKATERQRLVSDRARRATFLTGLSTKLAEKGHTLNRDTLASMLSSGIPDIEKLALEGFKALSADEVYNAAMAKTAPAPTGGAPAPMAAAVADAPISTANDYVTGVVAPGIPIARSTAGAKTFSPATGDFELVPDRNQAASGRFDKLTKTYSPAVSSSMLSPYEQLNKLNNILADLTNDTNLTPQNEIKIQNIKDEINRLTTTNAMAPQAAPAPTAAPAPAAAPPSELQVLLDQRNKLQRIRPQTPDDVARLNNTLNGIDKQIERLTTTGSSLSKLIAERDRLPPGDLRIATYDDAIKKESQNVAKAEPLADFAAFMRLSTAEQDAFLKFKRAGAGNVTATATTGPVGKSLSEPVGKRVETSLVKAEGATSMMDTANSVREALNAGNVIAGPLAGVRTKFAQVLELAGAGDKEKLVNTRTAIQGLAALTLESRAELRGQGQITDTETKLLEKARSADINDLTIPELQQVVNVSQRLASRLFSNHETLLGRMKDDPAAKDSMRYYEPTGTLAKPLLESKTPAAQSKDEKRPSLGSIFGNPPQGVK